MLKKIKEVWEIANYPVGKDKDFDEDCDNAFHRFLDRFINVSYFCFALFGAVSVYFFITHEIMK